jgi:hypothetical protein
VNKAGKSLTKKPPELALLSINDKTGNPKAEKRLTKKPPEGGQMVGRWQKLAPFF